MSGSACYYCGRSNCVCVPALTAADQGIILKSDLPKIPRVNHDNKFEAVGCYVLVGKSSHILATCLDAVDAAFFAELLSLCYPANRPELTQSQGSSALATPEWLQEVWGYKKDFQTESTLKLSRDNSLSSWLDVYFRLEDPLAPVQFVGRVENGKFDVSIYSPTRQQFLQLAAVFGIKPVSEESVDKDQHAVGN